MRLRRTGWLGFGATAACVDLPTLGVGGERERWQRKCTAAGGREKWRLGTKGVRLA